MTLERPEGVPQAWNLPETRFPGEQTHHVMGIYTTPAVLWLQMQRTLMPELIQYQEWMDRPQRSTEGLEHGGAADGVNMTDFRGFLGRERS